MRPKVTAAFEVHIRVAKTDQTVLDLRIVIENPVIGVLHSLQAGDDTPLDPKRSREGEALVFDFPIRVGPARSFSAIRCAAKVPCAGLSIFASANWQATPPRLGPAG